MLRQGTAAFLLVTLLALPLPAQPDTSAVSRPWPSFRGLHASGVADGQQLPSTWDVQKGDNIRWQTPLPGLGHSCPILWGDRVFLTTALSADPESGFKRDPLNLGIPASDTARHFGRVYCLDQRSGGILWERTAWEGVPKTKRHPQSSYANATPATDGRHLIVFFGSEGLYGYDLDGKLLWKQDLGIIDAGAFDQPLLQWGAASSPILYKNLVLVQCDQQKNSFVAAFHVATGEPVWRTPRDELPSWATPTIYEGKTRVELITAAPNFSRGYDPLTGKELWRLAGHSKITIPTPFVAHELIFLTDGYYRPGLQPIYTVRPGANGEVTLPEGQEASEQIAWSRRRGGPYMPTPLVYGDHLYVCKNNGLLTCYEAKTGQQVYEKRLPGKGGYSASPVAADGKVYFTSEEGSIHVVKAGPTYELLATNLMNDLCLATPAIANNMLVVRTQHAVVGIGQREPAAPPSPR